MILARGQRRQGCRLIVASVGVGKGAHCPAGRKGCARGSMPASAGGACACGMRVRTLVRGSPKASPRDDDVRPTLFCFDSPPRLEECWRDRWKLGNLLGPWSFCSCLLLVVVSQAVHLNTGLFGRCNALRTYTLSRYIHILADH